MRITVLLLIALLVACTAVAADEAGLQQVEVFTRGQDGYHTYRIPSLLVTQRGTVLAFCEGRKDSGSDTGDIDLLLKRSTDGGRTWSNQQVLWDDAANTCGNPCPVVDETTGTIHLLLTWNRGDDNEKGIKAGTARDTRRVFVCSSTDDGVTWTQPRDITATTKPEDWRWYATGPGVGIQLKTGKHKGRMVIPCDHSVGEREYRSHAIYSDDHGKTWHAGKAIAPDVNECQVVELNDGRLMMNMRNYKESHSRQRAIAFSADGGESWSDVTYDPTLVEPVCQASLIRVSPAAANGSDPRLLFSNPATRDKRVQMTVRLSPDEGKTWPIAKLLHAGPAAYSNLAMLDPNTVGCLYERGEKSAYERITLARFSLQAFMD